MINQLSYRALALVATATLFVYSVAYATTSDQKTLGDVTVTTYDNGDGTQSFGAVNNSTGNSISGSYDSLVGSTDTLTIDGAHSGVTVDATTTTTESATPTGTVTVNDARNGVSVSATNSDGKNVTVTNSRGDTLTESDSSGEQSVTVTNAQGKEIFSQ